MTDDCLKLHVRVYSNPVSQGSKIPGRSAKTGKLFVREQGGQRHKDWRKDMVDSAIKAREELGWDTVEGPVFVALTFYVPRPPSVSIAKRPWPHVRPDLDKLCRTALDSLTSAAVFHDDAQVVGMMVWKYYAGNDVVTSPGVLITVVPCKDPIVLGSNDH